MINSGTSKSQLLKGIGIGAALGLLLAGVLALGVSQFKGYVGEGRHVEEPSASAPPEAEPLYWVAPMDANFRRDKPGKSPMGMDLIPVYGANPEGGGKGTVKISSAVINNLGVRTEEVARRRLEGAIRTVGYVRYDEDKLVHIHPRIEGWIDQLFVQTAGDPVQKGQPLYSIYSPTLVNAQEELLLALERKNSRLINAAEQRLSALQIPRQTIAQLRASKRVKQSITFFSPIDGVVDNLSIRKGFFVKPGTTLMSIGSVEAVWVEAEIFERQASQVYEGAPVAMTLNYLPGGVWRGVVDYVYPVIDAKTRTAKVRMRFSNEDGALKPNMFAQVVIQTASDGKTLTVSKEALIRTGRMNRLVVALGDGRFKTVEVKLGRFGADFVEILSGVKEGERVVTSSQFLIDSESSKTSDFQRIDSSGGDAEYDVHALANGEDDEKNERNAEMSAEVDGIINRIDYERRVLNIFHGPIPKWKHPVMPMNFKAAEHLDISQLSEGMRVHFSFVIAEGQFMLTEIVGFPDEVTNDSPSHSRANESNQKAPHSESLP